MAIFTYFARCDVFRTFMHKATIGLGHVKFLISLTYSYGAPLGYKRTAHAAVAL